MPIPPELVRMLRDHIETFGTARDGRLFSSDRGNVVASTALSDVWAEARTRALTPEQVFTVGGSSLRSPACGSIAVVERGVPPQEVAERAGHGVQVLLRVYAKCLDGGEAVANKRIEAALRDAG